MFGVGLPLDTTEEEFIQLMSKYGIIMQDPDTSKLKIVIVMHSYRYYEYGIYKTPLLSHPQY